MDLNNNIRNNIVQLRKDRGITQDILAASLEISVQAISKWETGVSLPDIMQLPRIAKFFGVTIDYLFYHEGKEQMVNYEQMPDDQVLRIVQFYGNKLLGAEEWQKDKSIDLIIPNEFNRNFNGTINMEVWGSANLKGEIKGNIECGGNVNGGIIGGCVECGGGINCGNIGGCAECGGSINCGNIGGDVTCDGNITCNNIQGDVTCDGDIIYRKQ